MASRGQGLWFVIGVLVCAQSWAISDRERKRLEFLNGPVFANTINKAAKEKTLQEEAEKRAQEAMFWSGPEGKKKSREHFKKIPKFEAIPSVAPSPTKAATRAVAPAPKSNDIFRSSASSAQTFSEPEKGEGQCGWNKFLNNYCHHKTEKGWKLCSDRWGGCIEQEQR